MVAVPQQIIDQPKPKVVWKPLDGSQAMALSCPCNHILHEGTRGPGKTDGQLMFFRKHVGLGYGQHWRGVIFDRHYKDLDDLISKSKRWFPQFCDNARFLSSKADYKWVWPTGEELLFRQIKKMEDYWNYHGQEFPFIGWNELTKFPAPDLYDEMMSCNRSSYMPREPEDPENIPLVVYSTTNPHGPGHNWVKTRFIDIADPGQIVKNVTNVFNPRTQQREDVVKTQVRIFGSYKENIYLTPEYIAELENIREENKRRAWLYGDWDVTSGGMFDDIWKKERHVLPVFPLNMIPLGWKITRSYDHGQSKPFSVGWWAQSNGEPFRFNNRLYGTVRGDWIRIHEWYGCERDEKTGHGTNRGIRKKAFDIALGILEIEHKLGIFGRVLPGVADSAIFTGDDSNPMKTVAGEMLKAGVRWEKSDKSPGTRKNGWQQCRTYLENAIPSEDGTRDEPGLYVLQSCKDFIRTFPVLPRDEDDLDDVDTDAEDHIGDETRYLLRFNPREVQSGDM